MIEDASAAPVLADAYARAYPGEVARLLESQPGNEVVAVLTRHPAPTAIAIFERLTPSAAAQLLERLPGPMAVELLTALDPSRAAALLARVDPEVAQQQLDRLSKPLARELRELMSYPPDTAGGLMMARVATFRPDATVDQILTGLRAMRPDRVTDVVLVDEDDRLIGTVALEDLVVADEDTPASRLMRRPPLSIHEVASRDEVIETMTQAGTRVLPVVDVKDRLLGIVRQDALVRAVREEVTADLQTMVGASKDEQALSPVSFAVRKRLPWLQVNLVTAFLAAAVVGVFEDTIAQVTALAVLLPVVAGQSGNTGAQALAVTMRGLALREIRVRQWRAVSVKEATVGLINGIGVAATTALGVYVWSRSTGLAVVIASSMVMSMVAAGLAGAVVPLALAAVKQDPAQSSSIVLTTVTDIVGFFSFLGIATLMIASL